ncbi:MAG TPA: VOC family protein [Gemmatimonadaceae bacterium]|nr:VOC family protein [Gemmatimonadaceae bacterium]
MSGNTTMPDVAVRRLTPVLAVDAVEPSLEFWEKRLGFTKTVEVPHGESVGFAILVKNEVELMLQSAASIRSDIGEHTGQIDGRSTALFIEVADLAAVERSLEGYPIEMPRRTTFYGMIEIGVREPGGHFVVFAQPEKESASPTGG